MGVMPAAPEDAVEQHREECNQAGKSSAHGPATLRIRVFDDTIQSANLSLWHSREWVNAFLTESRRGAFQLSEKQTGTGAIRKLLHRSMELQ